MGYEIKVDNRFVEDFEDFCLAKGYDFQIVNVGEVLESDLSDVVYEMVRKKDWERLQSFLKRLERDTKAREKANKVLSEK